MKWGARDISELSIDELNDALAQTKSVRTNFESRRAAATEEKRKLLPKGPSEVFINLEKALQQEVSKRSVSVRNTELK